MVRTKLQQIKETMLETKFHNVLHAIRYILNSKKIMANDANILCYCMEITTIKYQNKKTTLSTELYVTP